MKPTNLSILFYILISPTTALAEDPYIDIHDTMCKKGEEIYMSCSFNQNTKNKIKVASICAKNNTSPDSGYIQYRYGTPGEKPELQLPQDLKKPKEIFKIYKSDRLEGVTEALRFSSASYVYSFEKRGLSIYRLVVMNNGKEVFNKSCEEPGKTYLVDDAFEGIPVINLGNKEISKTEK